MILLISDQKLQKHKSRELIPLQCKQCEKRFVRTKNEIQKVLKKKYDITLDFCSRKCSSFSQRIRITVRCGNCTKIIEKLPSNLKKTKNGILFCNKSCAAVYNNRHREKKEITGEYRKRAFKYLSRKCNVCNYSEYLQVLQVHHKDRNRHNNSIDNLEILCPTCHKERHYMINMETLV